MVCFKHVIRDLFYKFSIQFILFSVCSVCVVMYVFFSPLSSFFILFEILFLISVQNSFNSETRRSKRKIQAV